jgi:hypothetical protein
MISLPTATTAILANAGRPHLAKKRLTTDSGLFSPPTVFKFSGFRGDVDQMVQA